jgi:hypothetical protein
VILFVEGVTKVYVFSMRDPRHTQFDNLRQAHPFTLDEISYMVKSGGISRVIQHRDERGATEYWCLPPDVADLIHLRYEPKGKFATCKDFPNWFLTDDGLVAQIDKVRSHLDKRYKNKVRKFWSGALIKGYDDGYNKPTLLFINSKMFKDGKVMSKGHVVAHRWDNNDITEKDPRIDAFLTLVLAHGDPGLAYRESFGSFNETGSIKAANRLLGHAYIAKKLERKLKDKIKAILKERGLEIDPESFVIGKRLDLLEKAISTPEGKGLATATKLLEGLEDMLKIEKGSPKTTKKIVRKLTAESTPGPNKEKLLGTATETTEITTETNEEIDE